MIARRLFQWLSPAGDDARLSILIFHRVHDEVDPLFPSEPDRRRFDQVMGWIARWFHVLPLDGAVDALATGRLPARAAAITFDDGYADNATNALPILQRHGLPATFFIATSFLDGGRMWNDTLIEAIRRTQARTLDLARWGGGSTPLGALPERRAALSALIDRLKYLEPLQRAEAVEEVQCALGVRVQDAPMLDTAGVRKLRDAGMRIGAHTCTHPILARASDAVADVEIRASKEKLESLLEQPVTLFAFPNGRPESDYAARHVEMVRAAGFRAAVSTSHGVATAASDPFQLPRFSPWDRPRARYALRMMLNLRRPARQPPLQAAGMRS
jgi:peptidoglycan/xylan/chitin deacetylase (PgdA/CDA1 family)